MATKLIPLEMTETYKNYMRVSEQENSEENKAEQRKLKKEIENTATSFKYSLIQYNRKVFSDEICADFFATIAAGIEKGSLGPELYDTIGKDIARVHYCYRIAQEQEKRHWNAIIPATQNQVDKNIDAVFTTLSDRLKTADSQEAEKICKTYDTIYKQDHATILTTDKVSQYMNALMERKDIQPDYLHTIAKNWDLSFDTRLAYMNRPETSVDQALQAYLPSQSYPSSNPQEMPQKVKNIILQKLLKESEKNPSLIDQIKQNSTQDTTKDRTSLNHFVSHLSGKDIKDLPPKHWIVLYNEENREKYKKAMAKDTSPILKDLKKWFDSKTQKAKVAAIREQRSLTEKEEKELILAAYVYATLANAALFETITKGKASSTMFPDTYLDRTLGLLSRSKESGLAPQQTTSGEESMQISYTREIDELIPEEMMKEVTTLTRAKGLRRLLGKKDPKPTYKLQELNEAEKNKERTKLNDEFADRVEKSFYENLAHRTCEICCDMPLSQSGVDNKAEIDAINTQIIKAIRATEIAKQSEERYNSRQRKVTDVNGHIQRVDTRSYGKADDARFMAIQAMKKARERN